MDDMPGTITLNGGVRMAPTMTLYGSSITFRNSVTDRVVFQKVAVRRDVVYVNQALPPLVIGLELGLALLVGLAGGALAGGGRGFRRGKDDERGRWLGLMGTPQDAQKERGGSGLYR